MAFPREHRTRIRTNNPLERVMREIRRRTRVVGAFPDGNSALMLVAARLRHIAGTKWGTRKYLDMSRLDELLKKLPANIRTEIRNSNFVAVLCAVAPLKITVLSYIDPDLPSRPPPNPQKIKAIWSNTRAKKCRLKPVR